VSALIVAIVFFAFGSCLVLNPANVTTRLHERNVDWWSRRKSGVMRSWGLPQEAMPLWVVRYGVGFWFCGCAVVLAIVAR